MPLPKRSMVWKYFQKGPTKESVFCTVCDKELKYHNSTTNLKSHLKGKHPHLLGDDEGDDPYNDADYHPPGNIGNTPSSSRMSQSVYVSDDNQTPKAEDKQVLNYQKLVVPMTMRSNVWKCYGFPASADGEILTKSKIVCLLCKNVISYTGNTSNLKTHIQHRHPQELVQLELTPTAPRPKRSKPPRDAKRKKDMGNMYSTNLDGSMVLGSSGHDASASGSGMNQSQMVDFNSTIITNNDGGQTQTPHYQVIINKGMKNESEPCTIESLHPFMIPIESKSVSDAIAEFVVMDLQLPDVVEGRGFQRLIATLKSPCEIPSRSKLVDEVIPRVYENCRDSLMETVAAAARVEVSLTIEEWNSSAGDCYVTFAICYQQEGTDTLHNRVLSTIHCTAPVDSQYWGVVIDSLLEEWKIPVDKVKAVICGSPRLELVTALVNRGLIVLPCLVQTLQEVCTRVCFEQDDVRDILTKCRACIYQIFKNTHALDSLRVQDNALSLEESPLVPDFPRVWLTTYMMLEGMLARRAVMSAILDHVPPTTYDRHQITLTDSDWQLIEDVLTVLEPFKVTLMTLSEEKAPLISLLKPLLWQLISSHLKDKPEDTVNAQVFKVALKTLLSEKYTEPVVNQLMQTATALDPRFKSLPHAADESRQALEGPIKNALVHVIEQTPEEVKPQVEEPEKKKPRLLGMVMLLGDMCPSTSSAPVSAMSCADRAALEIVQYQSEPAAPLDACPVAWWSRTAAKCPHLSRLAAQYTCVPATAVPVTRLPLEAQVNFEVKRGSLSPEIIDRLVFLNANYHI